MAINCYTGLQGSGKSYEVVSGPLLEAVLNGRRVVTNIEGIDPLLIAEYLFKIRQVPPEKQGTILQIENKDVDNPEFYPHYVNTDVKPGIVKPGDLVIIDEAWRFYGPDKKIQDSDKSFFLEHRHFTNPLTSISCDLILIVQDISTLNRFVKNVVSFSFRTHKKVSLGLNTTYSLCMYEGPKMIKACEIGNWVKKYDKAIFPLYSSFKGGVQGKILLIDKRQNIFSNKYLWIKLLLFVVLAFLAGWKVYRFFHPSTEVKTVLPVGSVSTPIPIGQPLDPNSPKPVIPVSNFSLEWRISGHLKSQNDYYIILTSPEGITRLAHPSSFNVIASMPWLLAGEVDGQRVTVFSGVQHQGNFNNSQKKP